MITLKADLFRVATAEVGEGPTWDAASQRLLWVDVHGNAFYREDLSGDASKVETIEVDRHIGAVMPTTTPNSLLVMLRDGFFTRSADGTMTPLATPLADRPEVRFNDGGIDPRGRAFGGTMPYEQGVADGALYRLDPGPKLTVVREPVKLSNGLDWSNDGRTMFFVDSGRNQIVAIDYDLDSGALGESRLFAELPEGEGMFDGLTIDHDDCVWVALWGAGALRRYTPDGRLERVVELPVTQPTSMCFAGPDLSTLVITSANFNLSGADLAAQPLAGSLFALNPGCSGPAATPWRPF